MSRQWWLPALACWLLLLAAGPLAAAPAPPPLHLAVVAVTEPPESRQGVQRYYAVTVNLENTAAVAVDHRVRAQFSHRADFASSGILHEFVWLRHAPGATPFHFFLTPPAELFALTDRVYARLLEDHGVAWDTQTLALPAGSDSPAAPPPADGGERSGYERGRAFATVFLGILLAALPFIVLGSLMSGIIEVFISPETLARLFPRRGGRALLTGLLFGLVFPVCECGVVPVGRRLFRKGVPPAACLVFILAAPIVNLITLSSTALAFGAGSALWWGRLLGGGTVALLAVGILSLSGGVQFRTRHGDPGGPAPDHDAACGCGHDHGHDHGQRHEHQRATDEPATVCACGCQHGVAPELPRWRRLLTVTAAELYEFMFYIVLGGACAAALQTLLPTGWLDAFSNGRLVPVLTLMLVSVLLSICSSADAFVAAGYPSFPDGAVLAFLLLGPVFDLKLLLMYWHTFRPRTTLVLIASVSLLIAAAGWAVNLAVAS